MQYPAHPPSTRPSTPLTQPARLVVDAPSTNWLRVPQGPVLIMRLSFGASSSYERNLGLPVLEDHLGNLAPADLALAGAAPCRNPETPVTAAFVMGRKQIALRAFLRRARGNERFAFIRASVNNVERIPLTRIEFSPDGAAELDLPVKNIDLDHTGTLRENWAWDCAASPDGKTPPPSAWHRHSTTPVRIFLTAGIPTTRIPCESFFHIACESTTHSPAEAQAALWQKLQSGNLTNARGTPLRYWTTSHPGNASNAYVCRQARELIHHADASCLAWADLLKECLAIHGIRAHVKYVWADPNLLTLKIPEFQVQMSDGFIFPITEVGLIVRSFKWTRHGSLTPCSPKPGDVVDPGDFRWKANVPTDLATIPWEDPDIQPLAQPGNLASAGNAYGIFCNHAVVMVENPGNESTWFDPAHGIGPHSSLLDYQNDLLGTGTENHGGLFAVVGYRPRSQPNPLTGKIETNSVNVFIGATPPPTSLILRALDPTEQKPK